MHNAIQISKLNDFIFSPKSIFYHSIYESFSEILYHSKPQTSGRIAHEGIDRGQYSSTTKFLQGLPVYSEKFNLVGKIDLYNKESQTLIERKYHVKKIYKGYILQLYAQLFCLQEVGYAIKKLKIHSLKDNKTYNIPLPKKQDIHEFEKLLKTIRSFDTVSTKEKISKSKLDNCIYKVFYA